MAQTLTELFNNLSVAPQPSSTPAPTFNGMIRASQPLNVGNTVQLAGPAGTAVPSQGPTTVTVGGTPNIVGLGAQEQTIGSLFAPQPGMNLDIGGVSLANPLRNTASTRIIG